jgi:hypothetical protein
MIARLGFVFFSGERRVYWQRSRGSGSAVGRRRSMERFEATLARLKRLLVQWRSLRRCGSLAMICELRRL